MTSSEYHSVSALTYIILIFVISCGLSIYILYSYANKRVFPIFTYLSIFSQLFCAVGIVLIIPLDLAITLDGRKSEDNKQYYNSNYQLIFNVYVSLYWSSTILSNIILPFEEQYNSNGFLTVFSKLKNTFKKLSLVTFCMCVVCCVFFSILIFSRTVQSNLAAIFLTSVLITNTIWMMFLMLLLGYGLIMFPLHIWKKANYQLQLDKVQHKIALEFENVTNAYSQMFVCIGNIMQTKKVIIEEYDSCSELICAVEQLIKKIPIEIECNGNDISNNIIYNKQTNTITLGSLANYAETLYFANCKFTTAQGTLNKLQLQAYNFEDILNSVSEIGEIDSTLRGHHSIEWSFKPQGSYAEYIWLTNVKPFLFKLFGIICACLSVCSYLGVIVSIKNVPPNISPYYKIIELDSITPLRIIVFSFITIGYIFQVAKWSLFQTNVFKSLKLVNNKITWPIPMSINSRIFASISIPLMFFYLGWLHENGILDIKLLNTVFSDFYQMRAIPIAGNPFNAFFPIFLLCVSFLTTIKQLNNFLKYIGFPSLQFDYDEVTDTVLEEGKLKLSKRKKLLKNAYLNMLKQTNQLKHLKNKTFFGVFFNGFKQQSKFHSDVLIENSVDLNGSINLNNSISLTGFDINDGNSKPDIITIGKKIGSFSDMFAKYSVRPIDEEII